MCTRWLGAAMALAAIFVALHRHGVMAMPDGAPDAACQSMQPSHRLPPRPDDGSYSVNINTGRYYQPSTTYQVTVSAIPPSTILGVFCQVRDAASPRGGVSPPIGVFTSTPSLRTQEGCSAQFSPPVNPAAAITHRQRLGAASLSFDWTSPDTADIDLQVRCTVVRSFVLSYLQIPSAIFSPLPPPTTQPATTTLMPTLETTTPTTMTTTEATSPPVRSSPPTTQPDTTPPATPPTTPPTDPGTAVPDTSSSAPSTSSPPSTRTVPNRTPDTTACPEVSEANTVEEQYRAFLACYQRSFATANAVLDNYVAGRCATPIS